MDYYEAEKAKWEAKKLEVASDEAKWTQSQNVIDDFAARIAEFATELSQNTTKYNSEKLAKEEREHEDSYRAAAKARVQAATTRNGEITTKEQDYATEEGKIAGLLAAIPADTNDASYAANFKAHADQVAAVNAAAAAITALKKAKAKAEKEDADFELYTADLARKAIQANYNTALAGWNTQKRWIQQENKLLTERAARLATAADNEAFLS